MYFLYSFSYISYISFWWWVGSGRGVGWEEGLGLTHPVRKITRSGSPDLANLGETVFAGRIRFGCPDLADMGAQIWAEKGAQIWAWYPALLSTVLNNRQFEQLCRFIDRNETANEFNETANEFQLQN